MTDVTGLFAEGGAYAIVGAAMVLAYRLTQRARTESIEIYRRAVTDSDTRLAIERAAWAAERLALLARIAQLEGHPVVDDPRHSAAEPTQTPPPKEPQ